MMSLRAFIERFTERYATAQGLVMGRRVRAVPQKRFAVLLDVQFEHLGRQHQSTVEPASFDNAVEARQALGQWPIGSRCRLRFPADHPEAAKLAG